MIAARDGVGEELRLDLVGVRHAVPGTPPGRLPTRGQLAVPFGQLADADGAVVGSLQSVAVPGTGDRSVLHTLTLPDGTILGIGPHALDGPYAVVGGSGRYAGAAGSYDLAPLANEDDGHSIVINLQLPEA